MLPSTQDYLVVLSSVPGFVSHRDPEHGAFFIDELCNALVQHVKNNDLQDILLYTTKMLGQRVAFSNVDSETVLIEKQTCLTCSTLIKKINFF